MGCTWIALIYPYIEQQQLYNTIDHRAGMGHGKIGRNDEVKSTRIPTMNCPSDQIQEGACAFYARGALPRITAWDQCRRQRTHCARVAPSPEGRAYS
jgi:hypothetical protein